MAAVCICRKYHLLKYDYIIGRVSVMHSIPLKLWRPLSFCEVLITSGVTDVSFFQLLILESIEAYVELPEGSCFVSDNYRIHPACKESSEVFEL